MKDTYLHYATFREHGRRFLEEIRATDMPELSKALFEIQVAEAGYLVLRDEEGLPLKVWGPDAPAADRE